MKHIKKILRPVHLIGSVRKSGRRRIYSVGSVRKSGRKRVYSAGFIGTANPNHRIMPMSYVHNCVWRTEFQFQIQTATCHHYYVHFRSIHCSELMVLPTADKNVWFRFSQYPS
jgi:hypothetical protein